MTPRIALSYAVYFAALVLLAAPLGAYVARALAGDARWGRRLVGPLERRIYRLAGVDPAAEMGWRGYALALLAFNALGGVLLYALQRWQGSLPFNPLGLGPVAPRIAFNTAVSFVTNTNWQAYAGETTMSHLTQMAGLTVQNFLSAATGIAVAAALARGFARRSSGTVGNFWVDVTRGTLYVLLPLAFAAAVVLASQGVVQTFAGGRDAQPLQAAVAAAGAAAPAADPQRLVLGPAASQVAIKQLGTNGGGYYNVNSAHPFENPTPLSNFVELLLILLLPATLCFTFGSLVGSRRHGWMLLATMLALVLPALVVGAGAELAGNPLLAAAGVEQSAGNLEGKEVRFGAGSSALWAVATTAASNGSVNAMHDSFTPLGVLAPLWLMQIGEVAFGGVGSGLYGLLMFALVAVFIAGLMVGRTPELLGKKIEAREIQMAMLAILLPAAAVLVGTAWACGHPTAAAAAGNPGPRGFTEILYAFSSAANNNGSALGGLDAARPFYAAVLALAMLIGRFGVIVPVLAVAGSLARKPAVPVSAGTLPTDTPLFVLLLVAVVILVGALAFVPALSLGPIVEQLRFHP